MTLRMLFITLYPIYKQKYLFPPKRDINTLQQSLKRGILHRLGFCQYKNYCKTSPTLGKIKEFSTSYEGFFEWY